MVGASATGVQLAAELARSGRPVTLSVGEHVRLPRTYRGRDVLWWMDRTGVWDERYDEVDDLTRARRLPSPQLVGTPERSTLDLNALADLGVELVGRWAAVRDGEALFSGGLRNVFSLADLKLERLLDSFDDWARGNGSVADLDPPERYAPTRVPVSAAVAARPAERRDQHDRVGHRLAARLRLARRARRRREGPASPRRRHGRQPGDVRPRAAGPEAAQVHLHPRHRRRRPRGGRTPQRLPGRARLIWLEPPATVRANRVAFVRWLAAYGCPESQITTAHCQSTHRHVLDDRCGCWSAFGPPARRPAPAASRVPTIQSVLLGSGCVGDIEDITDDHASAGHAGAAPSSRVNRRGVRRFAGSHCVRFPARAGRHAGGRRYPGVSPQLRLGNVAHSVSVACDDAPVSGAPDLESAQLRRELDRLRAENARLSRLLDLRGQDTAPAAEQLAVPRPGAVTMASPVEDKLALYADRFRARTDVYALYWENSRRGRAGGCPRSPAAGARVWTAAGALSPADARGDGRAPGR